MKKGFTLSEVLITLGVIGVVAAITLPILIKKHQQQIWTTQLKKTYSIMEQGFQKLLADEEVFKISETSVWALKGDTQCGYDSFLTTPECINIGEGLKKYFKSNGFLKYGEYENCLSKNSKRNFKSYTPFVLSDGSMIFMDIASEPETKSENTIEEIKSLGGHMYSRIIQVYIDVNGKKLPNKEGRDIFLFALSDEGKIYPYRGVDYTLFILQRPINNNSNYWRNDTSLCGIPNGKITDSTGYGCAARIMENGWKMDY